MPGGWLSIVFIVLLLALVAWQATTNRRMNRMLRHYRMLSNGHDDRPLDELLQQVLERVEGESRSLERLEQELAQVAEAAKGHIQNVGVVRYNAFQDTGGDQSFAIAMLDSQGSGALFNGIFHRTECRVYAKPIREWGSAYSLSEEEEDAIRKARAGDGQ
ncbi:MAG: DUF4446 family protein [Candidatus Dormibacteraeota bacterium]|nr:DUF4446 family protein [Candidatus Dormibacteraeota bacterium]